MQLKVYKGDITKLKVDAIVNAANSSLLPEGISEGSKLLYENPEYSEV